MSESWCQAFDFVYLIPTESECKSFECNSSFFTGSSLFPLSLFPLVEIPSSVFCFVLFVCLTSNRLCTCSCHAVC